MPPLRAVAFAFVALCLLGAGAATVGALDPSPSPFVELRDNRLVLEGQDFRFVGVNAYSLATDWDQNFGCGGQIDADDLFSRLPERGTARIWAWQGSMATNPRTLTRDWDPLDRVVDAAARHGVKLIMNLASQAGDCDDGHWKDLAWWEAGYRRHYDEDGYSRTTVPYIDWVREIVTRYRNSAAVGMWELVNEGEPSNCPAGYKSWRCYGHLVCPNHSRSALAMREFFDTVGQMVKEIDHNHLIGSGVIGGAQCGTVGPNYRYLHQSRYIDVASYHDYGAEDAAMPGDEVNGLARRITQARSLGKAIVVGEAGITGGSGVAGCRSLNSRAQAFNRKLRAAFDAGADGYLLWDVVARPEAGCRFDIAPNDPSIGILSRYRA